MGYKTYHELLDEAQEEEESVMRTVEDVKAALSPERQAKIEARAKVLRDWEIGAQQLRVDLQAAEEKTASLRAKLSKMMAEGPPPPPESA